MTQSSSRLRWLDALRGIAALTVCCYHFASTFVSNRTFDAITHYVDPGKYGVLLFFLVSGYVIPLSLERHGSLRRFWIGRLFRIYPAYLASLLVVAAAAAFGALPAHFADRNAAEVFIDHLIMMPELLGTPSALVVYWTLGYEMLFYLLVSALFVVGLHRMSRLWAVGFAMAALVVAGAGRHGFAPIGSRGRIALVALVALAVVGAVTGYLRETRRSVLIAVSLSVALVGLLFVHGNLWVDVEPRFPAEALSFMAVMFTGSMIYRAEHEGASRLRSGASFLIVLVALIATGLQADSGAARRLITLGLVAVSFAVVYLLRGRRQPRVAVFWVRSATRSIFCITSSYRVSDSPFPGFRPPRRGSTASPAPSIWPSPREPRGCRVALSRSRGRRSEDRSPPASPASVREVPVPNVWRCD
jgi:peptidoglycan/LPS O-acetylase OafA/YrhL